MMKLFSNKKWRTALSIVLVCAFLQLTACSKMTQENYDRLKVGMEYSQAVSLLGEPQECNAVLNAKNCTWGDDKRSIQAKIVADKVVWLSSKGLK